MNNKFIPIILSLFTFYLFCTPDGGMTDDERVQADLDELAIAYSGSDTASSVTLSITLPTSGTNGSTVSWSSSNTAVISNTGTVTRPAYGSGNASVTMTATVSYESSSQTKVFNLTVIELPYTGLTDAQIVAADVAALAITYTGTDTINNVTLNLTLPTSGSNGSTISWASDNTTVISTIGVVTRPPMSSGNIVVNLTATVSYGAATPQNVIFTLTVLDLPAVPVTDQEIVQSDAYALAIIYSGSDNANSVTSDLVLPLTGLNGSIITWNSNNTTIISNSGVVNRPTNATGNVVVVLTATVTNNSAFQDVIFNLIAIKLPPAGFLTAYSIEGVTFNMIFTPPLTSYIGTGDTTTATISYGFNIAETEVTYELWSVVYIWATTDAGGGLRADGGPLYYFKNPGRQGGDMGSGPIGTNQHPVTTINWRDAMVWTNALTEYTNTIYSTTIELVYFSDGDSSFTTPHRNSTDVVCGAGVDIIAGACDNPDIKLSAKGFRLPLNNEYELASRYISDANSDNDILDTNEFYPYNFASGADADNTVTSGATDFDSDLDVEYTTNVAIYADNSGGITFPVKSKSPNKLGIYDITGNVDEWVFEWDSLNENTLRLRRSGNFLSSAGNISVSWFSSSSPVFTISTIGMRIHKTN
jgi:formylglycine-generating enzyme required for sulfatase activity